MGNPIYTNTLPTKPVPPRMRIYWGQSYSAYGLHQLVISRRPLKRSSAYSTYPVDESGVVDIPYAPQVYLDNYLLGSPIGERITTRASTEAPPSTDATDSEIATNTLLKWDEWVQIVV